MSIASNLDRFYINNEIGGSLYNQHYKLIKDTKYNPQLLVIN